MLTLFVFFCIQFDLIFFIIFRIPNSPLADSTNNATQSSVPEMVCAHT